MITVVIGPPGAGKSTIAKSLAASFDIFVEADKVVADLYNTDKLVNHFEVFEELIPCINGRRINKNVLIKVLKSNTTIKTYIEDTIFNVAFLPLLFEARASGKSLLVDGMMPRFAKYFDQVICVDASEEIRLKNLMKRGVSEQRAKELIALYNGTIGK